jgi:hypothetical protein
VRRRRRSLTEQVEQAQLVSDARLPLRIADVQRPAAVRLDGPDEDRRLVWTWGAATGREPLKADLDRGDVLWRFIRLATADDAAILAFARQWGVLDLCEEHAFPSGHSPNPAGYDYRQWAEFTVRFGTPSMKLPPPCSPEIWEKGWFSERVDLWRTWARRWRSASLLLIELTVGRAGASENWSDLWAGLHDPADGRDFSRLPIDVQHSALKDWVDTWLEQSRVLLNVAWERGYRLQLTSSTGLFGVLAARFAAVMCSDISHPARCSRCGEPYGAERKPRPDSNNYCPACRPEVDRFHKRMSARRRRLRQNEQSIRPRD